MPQKTFTNTYLQKDKKETLGKMPKLCRRCQNFYIDIDNGDIVWPEEFQGV